MLTEALLILLLVLREVMHWHERRGQERERAALLEKAAGIRLNPEPAPTFARVYGSEADAWRVEQARIKAGGYESE